MSDYEKLMLRHAAAQTTLLLGLWMAGKSAIARELPSFKEALTQIEKLTEMTDKVIEAGLEKEDFGEPPSPI